MKYLDAQKQLPYPDDDFSKKLRKILSSVTAYKILGSSGDTWGAGGCHILAGALALSLEKSRIPFVACVVRDKNNLAQHVFLTLKNTYNIDADGLQSNAFLLAKMILVENVNGPWFSNITDDNEIIKTGIPVDYDKSLLLHKLFEKRNLPVYLLGSE